MIKTGVKLIVHSEEQLSRLQVLLLQNGISWKGSEGCVINYKNFPLFMFIYNDCMTVGEPEPTKADRVFSIRLEYFNNHNNEEIDIDFYLATKGTYQQTGGTLQ